MGANSWDVKRPINEVSNARSRLFNHRTPGAGKNSQGATRAMAIKGTPKSAGLIN